MIAVPYNITRSVQEFISRGYDKYEHTNKGLSGEVYEMRFPGTAAVLLIKLLLPLRTYQVRMPDSSKKLRKNAGSSKAVLLYDKRLSDLFLKASYLSGCGRGI